MFPFILIALGIIAAYELSPKVHGLIDEHVKAIEDAFTAHRAADEHLKSVAEQVSTTPTMPAAQPTAQVFQQLKLAWDANQAANRKIVDAATTARTEPQRNVVARGAAAVIDQQAKITAALKQLGGGECEEHIYRKVSARIKDALLAKLRSSGMNVSGENPWEIDTHEHGVMLRAVWDPSTQVLHLIVTSSDFGVPCFLIWGKIEPILKGIIGA
jgi:hypothetical protein